MSKKLIKNPEDASDHKVYCALVPGEKSWEHSHGYVALLKKENFYKTKYTALVLNSPEDITRNNSLICVGDSGAKTLAQAIRALVYRFPGTRVYEFAATPEMLRFAAKEIDKLEK